MYVVLATPTAPQAEAIYKQILADYPGSNYALGAREGLVILYFEWGRREPSKKVEADSAYEELLTKFAEHEGLPKAIDHIADRYRQRKRYKEARQLYQYIVDTWPEAEHAMESQRGVVLSSIRMGDDANAASELEKLISDFAENENMARAICDVADEYRELGRYDEALANYGYVVETWPETKHSMEAQSGKVLTNILLKDNSAADAALDALISKYGEREDIEKIIKEIADEYRELDRNHEAIAVYEKVAENWPDTDEAIESQTYVAKLYISASDDANAQAAVDKLVTGFTKEKEVVEAVEEVAEEYGDASRDDKAGELYRRIVATWPDNERAIWAQVGVAQSYVGLGDDPNVEAALDELVASFSTHRDIAKAVDHVADKYRQLGQYERAAQLYQYAINTWPEAEHTDASRMGAALSNALLIVESANDTEAKAAIDSFIADFNDSPDLSKVIYPVGKRYYNIACSYETRGFRSEAKEYFRKAAAIWERTVHEFPRYGVTKEACYFSGSCYQSVGEYEKAIEYYAKVVADWPDYKYAWNAQFLIARCLEELALSGFLPVADAATQICDACEEVIRRYPECKAVEAALSLLERWSPHKAPGKGESE